MKIYVMDAFAARLFGGNQAGVALPEGDVSDETMRLIAAELKHSETAFVCPQEDGSVDLRYFTRRGRWSCAATPPLPAFSFGIHNIVMNDTCHIECCFHRMVETISTTNFFIIAHDAGFCLPETNLMFI